MDSFSGHVQPQQGTENLICDFGVTFSPLDFFGFSPVDFSTCSPGFLCNLVEIAPKCGENCPISGQRKSVESCHVSGCHGFFGPDFGASEMALFEPEVLQSGFGVNFLFGFGEFRQSSANFSVNFDGEIFLQVFRPCFSGVSAPPPPKIHAHNCRHLSPISLSRTQHLCTPIFCLRAQRDLQDVLLSRGKNCLPIVSRQFMTRNYHCPNCLLKCLPNCLSPTEVFFSSFKIIPAVGVIARQVRGQKFLTAIFATTRCLAGLTGGETNIFQRSA